MGAFTVGCIAVIIWAIHDQLSYEPMTAEDLKRLTDYTHVRCEQQNRIKPILE